MNVAWEEITAIDPGAPYECYKLHVNGEGVEHWVLNLQDGSFRHCFKRAESYKEVIDGATPLAASTLEEAKEAVVAIYRLEGT